MHKHKIAKDVPIKAQISFLRKSFDKTQSVVLLYQMNGSGHNMLLLSTKNFPLPACFDPLIFIHT